MTSQREKLEKTLIGLANQDEIINVGYLKLQDFVKNSDLNHLKKVTDFIKMVSQDFNELNFDISIRNKGQLAFGKKTPENGARGRRIFLFNVSTLKFSMQYNPGLSMIPGDKGWKSIDQYDVLHAYLTRNLKKIGKQIRKASGFRPIDYAYFSLEERGPREIVTKYQVPRKVKVTINSRRGREKFRNLLMSLYDYKCCITGCLEPEALDAAHIIPHSDGGVMDKDNGLLLRTDIHTLFDLHVITISKKGLVTVNDQVADPYYRSLNGYQIVFPDSISKAGFARSITERYNSLKK